MAERNTVTKQALEDTYQQVLKDLPNETGVSQSVALACGVIRAFLGKLWFERHIMPNRRKPGFLTIDESSQLALDRSAYRTTDLAELLYNLQYIQGFHECIARMRNGDIDGTYAELDLGRMLYLNRVKFRYVVPQGKRALITTSI